MKTLRLVVLAVIGLVPALAHAGEPSGPQGRTWAEIKNLPDLFGPWVPSFFKSFNSGNQPIDFKPPFDKMMAELRRITQSPGGDVPSNSKLCMPNGPAMVAPGRSYEFLLTPGQVTIIPQNNYVRRVYTDGRGHPKPVPLSFQGDTIGHWEGNTLVMETVGLRDESEFIHALRSDKANRTVTIVERIQKTDANHMRVDTTLDSPVVFNKPLTYSANYNRTQFAVSEEICTQNNLAVDPKTGDQVFPSAPNNDHSVPPR